jgi:predicted amidohydrolase YtcJ
LKTGTAQCGLLSSAIGSAKEDRAGRIEPGHFADFVVLSRRRRATASFYELLMAAA